MLAVIGKVIALYRREPAATQAAVAAAYGAWLVWDRAEIKHTGVLNWQVIFAGAVALYGLLVRAQVVPVTAPKVTGLKETYAAAKAAYEAAAKAAFGKEPPA